MTRSNRKIKAKNDDEFVVDLVQTKETAGAYRFAEVDSSGELVEIADGIMGTIYLRKSALKAAGINENPSGLKVTIEVIA